MIAVAEPAAVPMVAAVAEPAAVPMVAAVAVPVAAAVPMVATAEATEVEGAEAAFAADKKKRVIITPFHHSWTSAKL